METEVTDAQQEHHLVHVNLIEKKIKFIFLHSIFIVILLYKLIK